MVRIRRGSCLPVFCVVGLGLPGTLLAQETPEPPATPASGEDLLARFRALAPEKRASVVRSLDRRLQRTGDEAIQRVMARAKGRAGYPPASRPSWFAPSEFAPGAAPRALIGPSDAAHRAATRGMARETTARDLAAGVVYEWATASIVQARTPPTDEQLFDNLIAGYVPGSDEAIAQVLAAIDNEPQQRRLATWFGHLYADRDGRVFADVTLYEAWCGGRTIEVPDTDAIAFARQVLETRSFTAPLPTNRRRERLYEKIRDAFAAHREYRSLRGALAATFVNATPALGPDYEALVPRCHWLWAACHDDPKAVAEWLLRRPDRTAVLREIDAEMAKDATAATARTRQLADLEALLRGMAAQEIARATG